MVLPESASRLGDSLAVELPALDRAALVRIQVPQPPNSPIIIKNLPTYTHLGFEPGPDLKAKQAETCSGDCGSAVPIPPLPPDLIVKDDRPIRRRRSLPR